MPLFSSMPDVVIAVRCVLALIFLSAAAGKLRHLATFQGVVANYRLLPDALVRPLALTLPPVEALVGIALLGWLASPLPLVAAAFLLAVFAMAMAVNLSRGRRHIDCGCFQSTLKQTLRWSLVARNGVMVLVAAATGLLPQSPPMGWHLLNGVLAGGAAFVVLQSMNTLWAIVPAFRTRDTRAGAPSH